MYEKQTWTTGDTITAEKMNHIEDGIAAGGLMVVTITGNDTDGYTADKTFAEIKAAYLTMPMVARYYEDEVKSDYFYRFFYKSDEDVAHGILECFNFKSDYNLFTIDSDNTVSYTPGD